MHTPARVHAPAFHAADEFGQEIIQLAVNKLGICQRCIEPRDGEVSGVSNFVASRAALIAGVVRQVRRLFHGRVM